MAARIKQMQAFMALTQMLVMPLFFLSGALYPLNGLPTWLTVLTRFDPLTYIVSPMRHAVFRHLSVSPRRRRRSWRRTSPGPTGRYRSARRSGWWR
jgi:ABC-type polysaccharide/polyol phosphate export permease